MYIFIYIYRPTYKTFIKLRYVILRKTTFQIPNSTHLNFNDM